MEAPEKIYLYTEGNILDNDWLYEAPEEFTSFEYIRTDAFIKKACEWLKKEVVEDYKGVVWENLIEDFKNYMEK